MLRLGLIGGGRTVRIGHAPALLALRDRLQVAALADPDPQAREDIGILLSVPPERRYENYRDMLLMEELDVVDIAVPHALHYQIAMDAVHAGAHLITERPLALSVKDAEDLLRLAELRGKQINVLHFYLYYPPFREAIRLVRAGAIGDPFFVRCEGVTGGYGAGTDTYHPEWHNDPLLAGGGVWLDSGYHSAYLCVALMGALVSTVVAQIGTYATDLQVDDTAAALLVHDTDGLSSIQAAWSVPSGGQRVFEVYGTQGTISIDHDGHPLGIFSNKDRTWSHPTITFERDSSFIAFFEAVYECLHFGAPPPVSHREALHTLEIITAGYKASESGTVEGVAD